MTLDLARLKEKVAAARDDDGLSISFSCAELLALLDRIETLESALRPFANIALLQDSNYRPGLPDAIDAPDLSVTPRDVRKARTALGAQ